jgi:hypothetical protein
MIQPEREELLSAYLDDEVSSEERALVERWLAESGELRQLRDELLSLRSDLRGLPRHRVGHDLAATVMHRSTMPASAEPSNRSAPALDSPNSGNAPAGKDTALGSSIVEWWNRGSHGRRFLWPMLAVAAALAILVFDARQRPAEFEVAQAPDAPAGLAEPADETHGAGAAAAEPRDAAMPEMSAAPAHDAGQSLGGVAPAEQRPTESHDAATNQSRNDFFGPATGRGLGARREMAPTKGPAGDSQAGALFSKGVDQSAAPSDVETIICPVTPEYLADRKFEALLDANQIRWQKLPAPPQLQTQANPSSPPTAPFESLGKSPLQSLYYLQADGERVNAILSQVPQADRLMEGNRARAADTRQQAKASTNASTGVQVMLVAPLDATVPAKPPAKPAE